MTAKKQQSSTPPNSETDTVPYIGPETMLGAPETTVWYQGSADSGKKALATALAKAQAECQNVAMNKSNPHFRSRYADLSAVRDAIVPVFAKHGLSILQAPHMDNFEGFALETRLMHESGAEIVWKFPLPHDINKMQQVGSAITYARRYTLSAIAGIASEEDDDGNAAQVTNGRGSAGGNAAGGSSSAGGNASGSPGGIVL